MPVFTTIILRPFSLTSVLTFTCSPLQYSKRFFLPLCSCHPSVAVGLGGPSPNPLELKAPGLSQGLACRSGAAPSLQHHWRFPGAQLSVGKPDTRCTCRGDHPLADTGEGTWHHCFAMLLLTHAMAQAASISLPTATAPHCAQHLKTGLQEQVFSF